MIFLYACFDFRWKKELPKHNYFQWVPLFHSIFSHMLLEDYEWVISSFRLHFMLLIYWFNQVNFKLYFVDGKRVYVSNQDKFIFEDNFQNEIVQVYSFAKGIMILCMKFWISSLRFYLYLCEFVIAFMESKSLGIIW